LSSKCEAVESLSIAGAATGSEIFRRVGENAALLVASGEGIGNALAATKAFSPTFIWILTQGERNGALESATLGLADAAEKMAQRRSQLSSVLIGPVLIGLIGVAVLFFVLAFFMPIFQLSTLVS